jgi:metal-dependent amidase/aminoacylase/carboxypeptidase family protein
VAAEIVVGLPLGRQPGGGSVSVAAIAGGSVIDRLSPAALGTLGVAADADGPIAVSAAIGASATNSVPDLALVRGEVRGYTVAEIEDTVQTIVDAAQRVCDEHGATYEWVRDGGRIVPPFPGSGPRALELIGRAITAVPGVELVTEERHATLEANYLSAETDVVALASGGRDPHQRSESIPAAELERLEALLLAIVDGGAAAP